MSSSTGGDDRSETCPLAQTSRDTAQLDDMFVRRLVMSIFARHTDSFRQVSTGQTTKTGQKLRPSSIAANMPHLEFQQIALQGHERQKKLNFFSEQLLATTSNSVDKCLLSIIYKISANGDKP